MSQMDVAAFGEHVNQINNAGFIAVGLGIGHELGLFDLLMKENRPMTSTEIAEIGDMKERYVREWLGIMVAGKIITLDPDTERYCISEDRHGVIKDATPFSSGIFAVSSRKEDLKKCFVKDGPYGIDYEDEVFWTWFSERRTKTAGGFVDQTLMPHLKDERITEQLEKGINVLDVGCGSGPYAIEYAKRFPNSTFTGVDLSDRALEAARENTKLAGVSNLTFMKGDVQNLPEELKDNFDLVNVIFCLHEFPDPGKALFEMAKVLKPDGFLSIVDYRAHSKQSDNVGDLTAAQFYTCSIFYCLPSSMMAEPRIGYGGCWGFEEMQKTIQERFNIKTAINLPELLVHYICTKK